MLMLPFSVHQTCQEFINAVYKFLYGLRECRDRWYAVIHKFDPVETDDIKIFSGSFPCSVRSAEYSGYYNVCHAADCCGIRVLLEISCQFGKCSVIRIVTFKDVINTGSEPCVSQGGAVAVGAEAVYAAVCSGRDKSADIFVPLVDQITHLCVCSLIVVHLYTGIARLAQLSREHGVYKNGRAGERIYLLGRERAEVSANVDEASELVFVCIGDQLLELLGLILDKIIVVKRQDRVVRVMEPDRQQFFDLVINGIEHAFYHQSGQRDPG